MKKSTVLSIVTATVLVAIIITVLVLTIRSGCPCNKPPSASQNSKVVRRKTGKPGKSAANGLRVFSSYLYGGHYVSGEYIAPYDQDQDTNYMKYKNGDIEVQRDGTYSVYCRACYTDNGAFSDGDVWYGNISLIVTKPDRSVKMYPVTFKTTDVYQPRTTQFFSFHANVGLEKGDVLRFSLAVTDNAKTGNIDRDNTNCGQDADDYPIMINLLEDA